MDDHRQQITEDIGSDMAFTAFDFFPPSMPRSSLAYWVLTDCESMIA